MKEPNVRNPKTFVVVELLRDEVGALSRVIDAFNHTGVNMVHIESRLKSFAHQGPTFHIDFEGTMEDNNVQELTALLNQVGIVTQMPSREVPWFPTNIRDLDLTKETLDGGSDLIAQDHPGFNDEEYKKRRQHLTEIAETYEHGVPIPHVEYTESEIKTWGAVYEKLMGLSKKYACKEYLHAIDQMEQYCGYSTTNVPQLNDISNFLQMETGFSLRPVQGLLSARDFLNALAFRVFFSTQYIRHHGNPFYTPEPDICHELMGHAPMFADRNFADFSHQIGLASLAASDADIDKLAACYWFTVEFGLCREGDENKAFGAGVLSSFGEMEWACGDTPSKECRDAGGITSNYPNLMKPVLKDFDPLEAATTPYPITTYQPVLFVADDMETMKAQMENYADIYIDQPFYPQYDSLTQSIRVTKSVRRAERTSTLELQAQKQKEYFDNLATDGA